MGRVSSKLEVVSGYCAALAGLIVAGWWVFVSVVSTFMRANAELSRGVAVTAYGIGLLEIVAVGLLSIAIVVGLASYCWRVNRSLGAVAWILSLIYVIYAVGGGLIRIVAVTETFVAGVGNDVVIQSVIAWAQSHPYSLSYGIGHPGNLVFGLLSLIISACWLFSKGRSRVTGWLFAVGGISGVLGVICSALGANVLTPTFLGGAAAVTVLAYLTLPRALSDRLLV